jgi:5-formyltetrahydrofolate cyclo-ligase
MLSIGKVIIYNSFKNEVKTNEIIKFLINNGYKVYNPCIINDKIIPCRLHSQKKMSPGPYGIPEPTKKCRIKSMQDLGAIIVPGIAFDKAGNRIGFGKGYFDEFLGKLNKNILKIGLAFSFQMLDKIPVTKNDVKMDVVITDKEIIYVDKKKKNLRWQDNKIIQG